MGLVSPSQVALGSEITSASINTPVNQLAATLNGNVDSNNLADSAVTNTKVAAGVQTSKLANPYKFSAYRSASQSATVAVPTKVQYNLEHFDTGSNYDSATNYRFTAPVAGFYYISASFQVLEATAGNIDCNLSIYKNGTLYRKGGNIKGAAYPQPHVSGTLSLAAGDYVEIYFINGVATVTLEGVSTSNHFDGFMVSLT